PGGAKPEEAAKTLGAAGAQVEGLTDDQMAEMRQLLAEQADRELTPDERGRLRELFDLSNQAAASKRKSLPQDIKADGPKRLAYLCRLLRKDRYPWAPLNGAIALVPWQAL